jgi:hypothetical protein
MLYFNDKFNVLIVLKSGSFKLLETAAPVQFCNGFALPLQACLSVKQAPNCDMAAVNSASN